MIKDKKFLIALSLAVVAVGGLFVFRHYYEGPRGLSTQAGGCYGYGCPSNVWIGARLVGSGYGFPQDFTYGTLTVEKGSQVEVTWSSQNVTSCKADKNWTKFTGPYLPVALYPNRIAKITTIGVTCTGPNGRVSGSVIVKLLGSK
jgi:hypothetical protein